MTKRDSKENRSAERKDGPGNKAFLMSSLQTRQKKGLMMYLNEVFFLNEVVEVFHPNPAKL